MSDRVVICLVGLTGSGKSETGNALCDNPDAFKVSSAFTSETRQCAWQDYVFQNTLFRIVDTPGFADTHLSSEELLQRFKSFADLAPDGVDCFLFVCQSGRFGKDKAEAFAAFEEACGPEVFHNTALLFTHDERARMELQDVLSVNHSSLPPALVGCLEKVCWRVAGIENSKPESQILARKEIHEMVIAVKQGCPGPYMHASFQEAQQWRTVMLDSATKLSVESNRTKVRRKLDLLLNGNCSRADVEEELHGCQEAEEAARVAAFSKRSFGQQEDLKDRIRGILHDYEAGRGIEIVVREFLQNADDHGATKFHVMLDDRAIAEPEGLFHSDMVWANGTALVLAMDSMCSDADLDRVQQLGNSGKRERFDQIGRFGLGMNTMYVFSDQPVLRSRNADGKDRVCFFDPLREFAARGLPQPGVRWEADELLAEFPGQLAPLTLPPGLPCNTIFRLALRGNTTYKPLSSKRWWAEEVLQQLEALVTDLPTWMCFLRSLSEVSIGHIDPDGGVTFLTEISAPVPPVWLDFQKKWPTDWASYARLESADEADAAACFTKTVTQRRFGSRSNSAFVIASRLLGDARDHAIENSAKNEYALAPLMSVALDLRALPAKLFSGLPLIDSSWVVHVDGFFEFPTSRRGLSLESEWNKFLLSQILPSVHCDLLLFLRDQVENGDVSIATYMKLFPTSFGKEWCTTACELYKLLVSMPVIPLMQGCGRKWATPLESYWVPRSVASLPSFNEATPPLTGAFLLADSLNKKQCNMLENHAGRRTVDAKLFGQLLKDETDLSWGFDDRLLVLKFIAALIQKDRADVASILRGTRLLCLIRPTRTVEVFSNDSWFRSKFAPLLPHVRIVASEIESLPGFELFPGAKDLTLAEFLRFEMRAAFAPALVTQLRTVGFVTRTRELAAWHKALGMLCADNSGIHHAQRQTLLGQLKVSDWPIILTDHALATGQFRDRAVSCRNLSNFYTWPMPLQPPVPPVLVWAAEVPPAMQRLTLSAAGVILARHAVQNWTAMCTEEQAAWSELSRAQLKHSESGFVATFTDALEEMTSQSLQHLPLLLAQCFFLCNHNGVTLTSNVRLNASSLGKLLLKVEEKCGQAVAWSSREALQILKVIAEVAKRDRTGVACVLTGTRLLCLSNGHVAVFGERAFNKNSVMPEMLDIPGFRNFPGYQDPFPADILAAGPVIFSMVIVGSCLALCFLFQNVLVSSSMLE